ncbi:MAG: rhodanese-like domain-containing protein [Pirellulales bacterium]
MPIPTISSGILNIGGYRFSPLTNLQQRRQRLKDLCHELQLKGTILLSFEGINLFVSGNPDAITKLLDDLRLDTEVGEIDVRRSTSNYQPFNRMLVKIKREIIAFGVEGIDPAQARAKKITPQQLQAWLDEDRPCTLMDVRNNYEVELGTFEQAEPIDIDHFRAFPDAATLLPDHYKSKPVVMFCTGGIRCEKAGPLLQRIGFREVYQLEGGILEYFKQCGSRHYQGECFVFDKRVALDADLQETKTVQCYICQHLLSAEEQQLPEYVLGQSCPACHQNQHQP